MELKFLAMMKNLKKILPKTNYSTNHTCLQSFPKAEEEIKKPCLTSIDIISGRLFYFKVEIIVYCIRKIENCNTYIFPQFTTELLAKKTNHQLVTKFTNHLVTFYLIAILALDRIVGIQFAEKKKMKKKIKWKSIKIESQNCNKKK